MYDKKDFFNLNYILLKDAKPKMIVTLNKKEDISFTEKSSVKHVLCEQELAKVFTILKNKFKYNIN